METAIYTKLKEVLEADIDRNDRINRLNSLMGEMMKEISGKEKLKEAIVATLQKYPELNIVNGYFQANHRLLKEGYTRDVSRKMLDTLCITKSLCEFWYKASGEEIPYDLQMFYSTLGANYELQISKKSIDAKLATVVLENQNNRIKRGVKAFIALTALNIILIVVHLFIWSI